VVEIGSGMEAIGTRTWRRQHRMIRHDEMMRTAGVNTMKEYRNFIVDMHQRSSGNHKSVGGGDNGPAFRPWGDSMVQEATSGLKQGLLPQAVAPAVSIFSI
jgi:hypothetical protein